MTVPAAWCSCGHQGYSYAEIAARLGISESSARVIEHRTRTWLKQQLAKEGYDL